MVRTLRLSLIGLLALVLGACVGAQHIVDTFNPNGIGLGDEATVERGPNKGDTVTVTGYDGGAKVETTAGEIPLAHLGVQSNTYYWCVGAWEWFEEFPGFAYWRAPHIDLLVGGVDLRTLAQAGQPGGIPEGNGLFVYHTDPNDATLTCKTDAGEQGKALTSDLEKSLISTKLGVASLVAPVTVCGVFLDYMVNKHDEIGINPLELSSDGVYRIHLGSLKCQGLPPFE